MCFRRERQLLIPMLDLSFSVLMLVGFADELGSRFLRTPMMHLDSRLIQTYLYEVYTVSIVSNREGKLIINR